MDGQTLRLDKAEDIILDAPALNLNYFQCHDMLVNPSKGQVLTLHIAPICRSILTPKYERKALNGLDENQVIRKLLHSGVHAHEVSAWCGFRTS